MIIVCELYKISTTHEQEHFCDHIIIILKVIRIKIKTMLEIPVKH